MLEIDQVKANAVSIRVIEEMGGVVYSAAHQYHQGFIWLAVEWHQDELACHVVVGHKGVVRFGYSPESLWEETPSLEARVLGRDRNRYCPSVFPKRNKIDLDLLQRYKENPLCELFDVMGIGVKKEYL